MTEHEADRLLSAALAEHAKVSIAEMVEFIGLEAFTVQSSQRARLLGDMISAPMPEQVRRIQTYDAIHRFLTNCETDPYKISLWLRKLDASRKNSRD